MIFQQTHDWVLASTSPRRSDILKNYGFKFEVISPNFVEAQPINPDISQELINLAQGKGTSVINQCPIGSIIIAADTVVVWNNQVLGKPQNKQKHFETLTKLAGDKHDVFTAYFVHNTSSGEKFSKIKKTEVIFKDFPEHILKKYVETEEGEDKAGGYGIQGLGTFLVDHLVGSYNNVIGFPIEDFIENMLKKNWLI